VQTSFVMLVAVDNRSAGSQTIVVPPLDDDAAMNVQYDRSQQ
jgi:hypothetical protein